MRKKSTGLLLWVFILTLCGCQAETATKEMPIDLLRDKIAGGWAGKMIGVAYGEKSEFRAKGSTYELDLPWEPDMVANSLVQDDLYVQMSFMMTMDEFGLNATPEQYAESMANAGYKLWAANAQARKNYWDGIMPPESGSPEYNMWADAIDFQIESDFIGLMSPGMPQTANKFADKIGHIMNSGDGVYGGMFVASLYAQAMIEDDIPTIVEKALRSIPAESDYARIIRDVIDAHARYPSYWRSAWAEIQARWGTSDVSGPMDAFNIDAKLNGGYIVMGLLYGEGDLGKTMEVSVRCGQDSDCNPSNAAAVIGVIKGYSNLDTKWTAGIEPIADSRFSYTDYSFNSIVEKTLGYALEQVRSNAGRVTESHVTIPIEQPLAPPLEVAFPSSIPISVSDVFDGPGWTWTGDWDVLHGFHWGGGPEGPLSRYADEAGATFEFRFNGTGVVLKGGWAQDGGKADVYIDGQHHRRIDTYYWWADEDKDNTYIWHLLNLEPGEHVVQLVVAGEKKADATGTRIYISSATVYASIDKSIL